MKRCEDFDFGRCCDGCHLDDADGGLRLEVELPDGDSASVCCKVAAVLLQQGRHPEGPPEARPATNDTTPALPHGGAR